MTLRYNPIWKPRVSKCALTGRWIVNRHGWRHRCGPSIDLADSAFTTWQGALQEANEIGRMRLLSANPRTIFIRPEDRR